MPEQRQETPSARDGDSPARSESADAPAEPAPKKAKRRRRWGLRLGVAGALAIVLYTLGGFFGVPLLIERVLVPRAEGRINGSITLANSTFNPFTMATTLESLHVADQDGDEVLAFDRFAGNFEPLISLFSSGWHFHRVELYGPNLSIEIDEQGRLNFARLSKERAPRMEPTEPIKALPRIVVAEMGIENANLSFEDRALPEPVALQVRDFSLRLDSLDTHPDKTNPINLSARTADGAELRWQGEFQANPLSSTGSIALFGLDLARFMPYAMPHTNLRMTSGILQFELEYSLDPANKPRRAHTGLKLLAVSDLHVEQDGRPVAEIPELRLQEIDANADEQRLSIRRIALTRPTIHAQRDENGRIALLNVIETSNADADESDAPEQAGRGARPEASAAGSVDPTTIEYPIERLIAAVNQLITDALDPWSTEFQQLTLEDATIELIDRVPEQHVRIDATAFNLSAGPCSSEDGYATPLAIDFDIEQGGRVVIDGTVRPMDRDLEADLDVTGLAMTIAAPYLPRQLPEPLPPSSLDAGTLSTTGALSAAFTDSLSAEWSGDITIDGVEVGALDQDLAVGTLGKLVLAGRLSATRSARGDLHAAWDGETTIETLASEAPLRGPSSVELAGASLRNTVEFTMAPGAAPSLSVRGAGEVTGFAGRFPQIEQADGAFDRLELTGIDFSLEPMSLALERIALAKPRFGAQTKLVPTEPSDEPAGEAPEGRPLAGVKLPMALTVGEILLTDGSLELRDEQVSPPASITIDQLRLEASGLSNQGDSAAQLSVESRVQGSGRMQLTGAADPFRDTPYADVELSVSDLPLTPYDPWAARLVGFLIEEGRLTMRLPMRLESGRLDGTLDANLDRFYLGERSGIPWAPSMPVKLGLSLLRDANQQINVTVPISGDTSDPNFRIGGVIWQAFFGTIARAATSPFRALASIFGAGEELDLSLVAFNPGSAEFAQGELTKMDTLSRAMRERPDLRLTVKGIPTPEADGAELRRTILRERMRQRVRAGSESSSELTEGEYQRAIRETYSEQVAPEPGFVAGGPDAVEAEPGQSPAPTETQRLATAEETDAPASTPERAARDEQEQSRPQLDPEAEPEPAAEPVYRERIVTRDRAGSWTHYTDRTYEVVVYELVEPEAQTQRAEGESRDEAQEPPSTIAATPEAPAPEADEAPAEHRAPGTTDPGHPDQVPEQAPEQAEDQTPPSRGRAQEQPDGLIPEPELPPFEEMERALLDQIEVPDERFIALAQQRVDRVLAILTGEGSVDPGRIESAVAEITGDPPESPRVVFELE